MTKSNARNQLLKGEVYASLKRTAGKLEKNLVHGGMREYKLFQHYPSSNELSVKKEMLYYPTSCNAKTRLVVSWNYPDLIG